MALRGSTTTSPRAVVPRSVLVDTSYLVALLDPRDSLNARAIALARQLAKEEALLVTSDAIVLELANYFARGPLRPHAARWIQAVRENAGWEVVPVDRAMLGRAEVRYTSHRDKNWSLTDCHTMEVMRQRKMADIATTDTGFEQAGFRRLMR
jgi:predicted nucleic acid-binding protein